MLTHYLEISRDRPQKALVRVSKPQPPVPGEVEDSLTFLMRTNSFSISVRLLISSSYLVRTRLRIKDQGKGEVTLSLFRGQDCLKNFFHGNAGYKRAGLVLLLISQWGGLEQYTSLQIHEYSLD